MYSDKHCREIAVNESFKQYDHSDLLSKIFNKNEQDLHNPVNRNGRYKDKQKKLNSKSQS